MNKKYCKNVNNIKHFIYIDKEEWKYIFINNIQTDYKISTFGNVYSEKTNKMMTQVFDKDG
jgi:hypothetical protein